MGLLSIFRSKTPSEQPQTLSAEFISRYWDLHAKVEAMDQRLDSTLEDLKRRQAAVSTAERRLDQKRANGQTELAVESDFDRVRRLQRGTS